ncbi:MAG TPA: L,D-transpeptidase [Bacteroidales bacterium]|jgi:murein L,D-transpeptidase YafK|nr:L,D-transpeptidase [Bacteroidales bacterium]
MSCLIVLSTSCRQHFKDENSYTRDQSATEYFVVEEPEPIFFFINYTTPLDSLIPDVGRGNLYIKITKSKYRLAICIADEVIKEYPAVFGGNPVDDKLVQGDRCTPEGNFKVLAKYPHRNWSRFILIDYPNAESMVKFREAKRSGKIPPDATPGGSVGIHGVTSGFDYVIDGRENWTLGCISLKRKDVEEIYDHIRIGTAIKVVR